MHGNAGIAVHGSQMQHGGAGFRFMSIAVPRGRSGQAHDRVAAGQEQRKIAAMREELDLARGLSTIRLEMKRRCERYAGARRMRTCNFRIGIVPRFVSLSSKYRGNYRCTQY